MANGGSCHQFRQKVAFAGPTGEKSRGAVAAGPPFAGRGLLCYRCTPIAMFGRGGVQWRKSIA
jgi:hypothetical protein